MEKKMTDKEILEAIKKEHQLGKKKPLIINTIHPQDVDWLIERAEKFEELKNEIQVILDSPLTDFEELHAAIQDRLNQY